MYFFIFVYTYIILYTYIFPSHHTVIYLKSSKKAPSKPPPFQRNLKTFFVTQLLTWSANGTTSKTVLMLDEKQLWHHHLPETFESKQIGYRTSLTWVYFKECFLMVIWKFRSPFPYLQSTRIPTIDNKDEVESYPIMRKITQGQNENNFK